MPFELLGEIQRITTIAVEWGSAICGGCDDATEATDGSNGKASPSSAWRVGTSGEPSYIGTKRTGSGGFT